MSAVTCCCYLLLPAAVTCCYPYRGRGFTGLILILADQVLPTVSLSAEDFTNAATPPQSKGYRAEGGLTEGAFQAQRRRPQTPWFFGLKGRFCQPRPKAWVSGIASRSGPERAVQPPPGSYLHRRSIAQIRSIPYIPLVPFDLVPAQPLPQFVLVLAA